MSQVISQAAGNLANQAVANNAQEMAQAQDLYSTASPFLKNFFSMTNSALSSPSSGGIGAQIPIIGRAIDQVNNATAQSLAGLRQQYAEMGGGRPNSAMESILAQTGMQGQLAASQVPTNLFMSLLGPALSTGAGLSQAGLSGTTAGAGQSAGLTGQMGGANLGAFGNLGAAGTSAFGNIVSAAMNPMATIGIASAPAVSRAIGGMFAPAAAVGTGFEMMAPEEALATVPFLLA